jgi:hypothetical protein
MDAWITQVWREIAERPDGPLAMRFYLQPAMAIFFAVRDGLKDARVGRPAYIWDLFSHPENRRELIRDGWKSFGKIFILAAVLDTAYQLIVFHGLRPVQTLLIATMLAVIPYVVLRGPVNRIARRLGGSRSSSSDLRAPKKRAS